MKKKLLIGVGFALVTILIGAGVIVGSVWVENRFPSDDAKRALLPGVQRVVTKPVVNTLSRQVERYIRSKTEVRYVNTGYTLEETIAWFLDERGNLADRRFHAFRLAYAGTPDATAALRKVLATAPPEHKAYMAQLIGSTGNPAGKAWLLPLLDDADERVVMTAIRGLSAIRGEDVTARIAGMLTDGQRLESVRVEAAIGLGIIGTTTARTALVKSLAQTPSDDLATQILNSLGRFEFLTVANTFRQYLAAPETPPAMRVAAVEALANSSTEAAPFLLELAQNDGDAEVRASAAWAISADASVNNLGPALADLAERESDADVRRRLYEAELSQAEIPAERLLPIVRTEEDIPARVAGFNALGRATKQQPGSAVAEMFDKEMVPELVQIATAPNSLNIQMRAVFALRRAQTPAAREALATIANNARPQIATAARNGLRASKG